MTYRLDPEDPRWCLEVGKQKQLPKRETRSRIAFTLWIVWVLSVLLLPLLFMVWGYYTVQPAPFLLATPTSWAIVLISPEGVVERHLVMSYLKPRPVPQSGGQIRVRDMGNLNNGKHDWEHQIIAPAGWRIQIEEANDQEELL